MSSVAKFEDLANEILLDLFDNYVDPFDLLIEDFDLCERRQMTFVYFLL